MEDLGEKTPVSKLQEYLVSQKMFPQYDLVHNGVGSHNPTFTYRVQAGALWEEGSGRSKREAKHRAAEKMLKSLNVNDSMEEEISEYNQEPAENFVGHLKELCKSQCYPEPKYHLEEEAGPPHCKKFRMLCCVSQLQEYGVSSTKKQAKHQAASKMLQLLKELKGNVSNIFPTQTEAKADQENKKEEICIDKIIEKYHALRPSNASTINKDPTGFYKDHHKAYVGLHETSSTLYKILNGSTQISSENSLMLIKELAQELEVNVTTMKAPAVKDRSFVIQGISVFPPMAGIGDTEENAALNLLNSLVFLCKD